MGGTLLFFIPAFPASFFKNSSDPLFLAMRLSCLLVLCKMMQLKVIIRLSELN